MIYTLVYMYILYVYNKGIQTYIDYIQYYYYFYNFILAYIIYIYSYTIHTTPWYIVKPYTSTIHYYLINLALLLVLLLLISTAAIFRISSWVELRSRATE